MKVHYFSVDVAVKYGVAAAIIFQNIAFWVKHNETNETNIHEGKAWTYNSAAAFAKQFPYLTEGGIRSALKKLKDDGIIRTGNFNGDRMDRTTWYTLTDKGREMYYSSTVPNEQERFTEGKPRKWVYNPKKAANKPTTAHKSEPSFDIKAIEEHAKTHTPTV